MINDATNILMVFMFDAGASCKMMGTVDCFGQVIISGFDSTGEGHYFMT